jgi:hypothetical protein
MYIVTQPALAEYGRGAGYLVNRLRVGNDPPEQYRQLAAQILDSDERQRQALGTEGCCSICNADRGLA